MKIQPHAKLLMIGDSITDWSRARPVAEAVMDSLGTGYVGVVNAYLTATWPQQSIRVVNMGVSGNTVRDLAARWSEDVLALNPDWLSIMIGINDVWRHFDARLVTDRQVSLDEYARTLEDLISAVRPGLQGLVLMTPYFVEPNRADPMRVMMERYAAVVRQLAERYEAVLVDTQAAFDTAMIALHPMALAPDRIHPNLVGHMVLARAFVNSLDCGW